MKEKRPVFSKRTSLSNGVALLESLIAIIIVSFGLLGVAALQVVGMKNQKDSRNLQLASESLLEIAEMIHSNPAGVRAGSYVYDLAYSASREDTRTLTGCDVDGSCTASQIAADNLTTWLQSVQATLPAGAINLFPLNSGFVATTLWADKDNIDADSAPISAQVCTDTMTGTAWRNCCPQTVSAPPGVRCIRHFFLP